MLINNSEEEIMNTIKCFKTSALIRICKLIQESPDQFLTDHKIPDKSLQALSPIFIVCQASTNTLL